MRTIFSIFLLAYYALSISAQVTYYYSNSKKIPLYANSSKVIVRSPKGCLQTIQNIPSFNPVRSMSCLGYDLTLVEKDENVNLEAIRSKIPFNTSDRIVYPCYRNEAGEDIIPTSYIYVQLNKASDYQKLQNVANEYGCRILKQNIYMPLWYTLCIAVDTGEDSVEIAKRITETNMFANACPAFEVNPAISYDPFALNQWGLYNSDYEDIDISASEAWNYATGRGVTVAVIDSGIELTHEDLIDNLHPLSHDAASSTNPSTIHNYRAKASHGTICAGIIGAVRNNDKGMAGVAPDVTLMSVSVNFGEADIEEQLANGIIWAYTNGADILSCSWGGFIESPIIEQAIDSALENGRNGNGCIIVCAAGNGFLGPPIQFPANYREEILAVGNIRKSGIWNETSAIGDELFICAPGTNIFSTMLDNSYGDKEIFGEDYEVENSGTSMACPHVSGVVALMLELNPHLTNSQIQGILATTTKKVGHMSYSVDKKYGRWNECYGYGLINAAQAVKCTPRIND